MRQPREILFDHMVDLWNKPLQRCRDEISQLDALNYPYITEVEITSFKRTTGAICKAGLFELKFITNFMDLSNEAPYILLFVK
jgi:hypothetical protein